MKSEEEEMIIAKFKRHGHSMTRKSLQKTMKWLSESQTHTLEILLKKLNQLSLDHTNPDQNLHHAIEILALKTKGFHSYEDLLQETRRRSIYALTPYERDSDTWFAERPKPQLFDFRPEEKLKISLSHFKRVSESNKDISKGSIMGIIYDNYSILNDDGKQKAMLQNEINQIVLTFPQNFVPKCLVVPGCTYIAQGQHNGKDLTFNVSNITLPNPPVQQKNSYFKQKFKQMCQNISAGKQKIGYQPHDFSKYDCVFTPSNEHIRPTLIFGNVTINNKIVQRLRRLVSAYTTGVNCVILMLSPNPQEPIDLSVWLKCKVYLIPHLSSEGPRLLPKLPLLKTRIPGTKVLTNPAKISLESRQIMLANYPLIKSIVSQTMSYGDTPQMSQDELTSKVSQLVFSQGTITMGSQYYWPQADYFNIHVETILVVTDNVSAMSFHKSKGKVGGLANSGNFDRDGDFLCLMTWNKNIVNFCEEHGGQ